MTPDRGDEREQLVAALWGEPPPHRRGRRPTIDRERVVEAAINRADLSGLEAVTMRALAEELGVGTMSLYTHVAGREHLLELMADRVVGELPPPPPSQRGWRAALGEHIRALWGLHGQHGWLCGLPREEPPLGPRRCARLEALVAALVAGLGCRATVALEAVHLVDARVGALALRAHSRRGGAERARWAALAPRLDATTHPHLTALATDRTARERGVPLPDFADPHDDAPRLERLIVSLEAAVAALAAGGE